MITIDYAHKAYIGRKTYVLGLIDIAIHGLLLAAVLIIFAGIIYMLG